MPVSKPARAGRRGHTQPVGPKTYTLTPNSRGMITLPQEMRKDFTEDTVLKAVLRDDGVLELRPAILVERSQTWFWSPQWQHMEREADEDIATGRIKRFDSVEALFDDLDATLPA